MCRATRQIQGEGGGGGIIRVEKTLRGTPRQGKPSDDRRATTWRISPKEEQMELIKK